jgi:hypothetical protein
MGQNRGAAIFAKAGIFCRRAEIHRVRYSGSGFGTALLGYCHDLYSFIK